MKQQLAVSAAGMAVALLVSALLARAAEQPVQPYPTGTLLTVAGNRTMGYSGDGGPASQAALNNPLDQAVDAAGNVYIGDMYNHRIRKVSPDGLITTVVGTGADGFSGDGGPALKARISEAAAVLVDAAGNLFFSDGQNHRIRKVDISGIITTVAGSSRLAGPLGDGGPATKARLGFPAQLALDAKGNLFIADQFNQRIRKVDAAGIITTVAGGGSPAAGRGDGGPAIAVSFQLPTGVAVDPLGSIYISEGVEGTIRKVDAAGIITTVAGGGQPADGVGDGGPATQARLAGPSYITLDPGGNLYIAENLGERIRKVDSNGIITTVAGNGKIGYTADGQPAIEAQLNSPLDVAIDRAGNLYFTEGNRYELNGTVKPGNNLVRKVIGVATPGTTAPGG
jgi:sugar lactone lactonase YvrE